MDLIDHCGNVDAIATDVDEQTAPYIVVLHITPQGARITHQYLLTKNQLGELIDDLKITQSLLD